MPKPARATVADAFTIANGVCGFLALAVAARLWLGHAGDPPGVDDDALNTCLLLYGIGMFCDLVDGPIARRFGSSGLGGRLDTISDAVSFGLLPAMLLIAVAYEDQDWHGAIVVVAAVYVGATILRLARNAKFEDDIDAHAALSGTKVPRGDFSGMPSPAGGNCVLAVAILDPPGPVAAVTVAVVAFLLMAEFPYPRKTGFAGVFVGALLVTSFAAIAGLFSLDVPCVIALVGLLPVGLQRFAAAKLAPART
jgi:CDP-diacylglycerol--serine O-phosphatidyltransferase